MQILRTKKELILWKRREILQKAQNLGNLQNLGQKITQNKSQNLTLGFVPTMGALHDGHISLIKASKHDNDKTLVSIFVNPAQFGANEDFDKYPRNEAQDFALCEQNGVDAVFAPNIAEMYAKDETIIAPPSNLANAFEGALREGHFNGVLRVVMKFFNLITPQNAYFGQKDAQQLLVIKKMVSDLFLPINIVPCAIMRDENGLALSSRNAYLNAQSYKDALKIPRAINAVREAHNKGELDSAILENIALAHLEPLKIDYCKIVDFNLKAQKKVRPNASLMLVAVRVKIPSAHRIGQQSEVRLLDNIWF